VPLRAREGRAATVAWCQHNVGSRQAALRLLADVADSFLRDPVGGRRWLPAPDSELGGGRESIAKFRSTETVGLVLFVCLKILKTPHNRFDRSIGRTTAVAPLAKTTGAHDAPG
jgi:hypothetical protein